MGMNVGNSSSNEPEVMIDINTTPLIDVMLVLLIMLIITIPIQLHSVNLDMPVSTPPKQKVEPLVVRVDIEAGGIVRWNGRIATSREDLLELAKTAAAMSPQPEIHIRAKGDSRYGTTATVLSTANTAGLTKIGIVGAEQFAD